MVNHDNGAEEVVADLGEHTITAAVMDSIALVEADGHLPVTTHILVAGSPYLGSDAAFSVKRSLVREFRLVEAPDAAEHGLTPSYRHADIELVLEPG